MHNDNPGPNSSKTISEAVRAYTDDAERRGREAAEALHRTCSRYFTPTVVGPSVIVIQPDKPAVLALRLATRLAQDSPVAPQGTSEHERVVEALADEIHAADRADRASVIEEALGGLAEAAKIKRDVEDELLTSLRDDTDAIWPPSLLSALYAPQPIPDDENPARRSVSESRSVAKPDPICGKCKGRQGYPNSNTHHGAIHPCNCKP